MVRADIETIAAVARQADRDEMLACASATVAECLCVGLGQSLRAWVIESDGIALAAVGDTIAGIGTGVPWMVTTDHIATDPRGFLRASKAVLVEMLQRHQQLINYVDARNAAAIRWLAWLGFTIDEAVPYGPQGLPFHKFHMSAGKACTGSDLFAGQP